MKITAVRQFGFILPIALLRVRVGNDAKEMQKFIKFYLKSIDYDLVT